MKARDNRQLPLFSPRGALPSQPTATGAGRDFSLEPSPDEIRICMSCGKQIIVRRRTAEGKVTGEFVWPAGACWDLYLPGAIAFDVPGVIALEAADHLLLPLRV